MHSGAVMIIPLSLDYHLHALALILTSLPFLAELPTPGSKPQWVSTVVPGVPGSVAKVENKLISSPLLNLTPTVTSAS